jgi:amidase
VAVDEFAWLDATAQAEMVTRGDVSPVELVAAAIHRIESLNPKINAVITPMYEKGVAAATANPPHGPFRGVPFLLKDLLASESGTRLTNGSAFLGDFIATGDSELVQRYKRAGLIIVGKTNTPEFGILGTTEPVRFGPTSNPWDLSRSTGGSSGGSAAAVAAGMIPMAHGNDGGGSIRIPASCCGVFGLKPSRGRISMAPEHGDLFSGLWAEHAVTRSVRDSARLLDATSGVLAGDPYLPPAGGPFSLDVGRSPGRLQIAFSTLSPTGTSVEPACTNAAIDAAHLCQDLGHDVAEAAPPLEPETYAAAFDIVWIAGVAWMLDHWGGVLGRAPQAHDVEILTWALYQKGKRIGASEYLEAVHELQRMSRAVAGFFEHYDVWLTPTVATAPPPLGLITSSADDPMRGYQRDSEFCPFTTVANVTGQPAMSVPLVWDDGLPIGTQFVGRFGAEGTLIRLAAQLEEGRPWTGMRPPTFQGAQLRGVE